MMTDSEREFVAKKRASYPKDCAHCGDDLDGPGTDEEILEMRQEHDRLFPGCSQDTVAVICDECFKRLCPGGKPIGMN